MNDIIFYLKRKQTYILCLIIIILYLVINKITGIAASSFTDANGYTIEAIAKFVGLIFVLFCINTLRYNKILKEKGIGFGHGLIVGMFLLVICILTCLVSFNSVITFGNGYKLLPPLQIIIFTASIIAVGINEELIFRGIVLNLILDKFGRTRKGIYGAVILSSLLFGLAHMSNILSGVSVKSAFVQAVAAAALGTIFAAVYIRSNNIWVVAMLHFLKDYTALIPSGFFGIGSMTQSINTYTYSMLAGCIIFIVPTVFLLRKTKINEIL